MPHCRGAVEQKVGWFVSCVNCKWNYMESMSNEHSSDAKLISNTFMEQRSLPLMLGFRSGCAHHTFSKRSSTYFSIPIITSHCQFIIFIHSPNTTPLIASLRLHAYCKWKPSLMEWFLLNFISKCCFSLASLGLGGYRIFHFCRRLSSLFLPCSARNTAKLLIFIKLDGTNFVSQRNSWIEKYNSRVRFDLI